MRSFGNLKTAVKFALIDENLSELLLDPVSREVLRYTLLEKYFPETKSLKLYDEITEGDPTILYESSEEYKKEVATLKKKLKADSYQEEIYVRGGRFKREVPKIYNNTCAISGWRVHATINVSMIDACHIVPFSAGYDDSIGNGIALSPNLHRAFDRGLICISENYKVLVNQNFVETNSPFNIKQFDGVRLRLPDQKEFWPALENIKRHREDFSWG